MYKDLQRLRFGRKLLQIAEEIFKVTNDLPRKEDYGLTSQLRRGPLVSLLILLRLMAEVRALTKANFMIILEVLHFETKSLLLYGVSVNYFNEVETKQLIELIEQPFMK
jgi:hypothetical protein